jgi:hypothetical protein
VTDTDHAYSSGQLNTLPSFSNIQTQNPGPETGPEIIFAHSIITPKTRGMPSGAMMNLQRLTDKKTLSGVKVETNVTP